MVQLLPSILSADFAHLAEQVQAAADGGGTVVHVDIMDGHFVPNMTLGPPVLKSLRKFTKLPLDCHLMIENPDQMIPLFAEAGADQPEWQPISFGHLLLTTGPKRQKEAEEVLRRAGFPAPALSQPASAPAYLSN